MRARLMFFQKDFYVTHLLFLSLSIVHLLILFCFFFFFVLNQSFSPKYSSFDVLSILFISFFFFFHVLFCLFVLYNLLCLFCSLAAVVKLEQLVCHTEIYLQKTSNVQSYFSLSISALSNRSNACDISSK